MSRLLVLIITSFGILIQGFQVKAQNKHTIMAIFAHPDDELEVTPLLSKYARQGHSIYLVFATKGEKGESKRKNIPQGQPLAWERAKEADCTCKTLEINAPISLGMDDGTLVSGQNRLGVLSHQKLDSIFSLYKPDIVITWGPDGAYGHTDHRMIGNIVTEIFQSGQSSYPKQLFYTGVPTENFKTYSPLTDAGKWAYKFWHPVKKEWLTVRIKYDQHDATKALKAMDCYQSQFTDEELEDNHRWFKHMNNDTVYLRPFIPQTKVTYEILK